MDRSVICCFTGHRHIPETELSTIKTRLEDEIFNLIFQGVKYFGAGGALGFDTLAALTVLKLKEQFGHIRLILVLPCKNQAKGWSEKDRNIYDYILERSDKIVYTSEYYYKGCMHIRNRHLVNNSGFCICYLKKQGGGTAYTVKNAKIQGLRVINLAN